VLTSLPIIAAFDLLWLLGIDSTVAVLTIGITVLAVAFFTGVFVLNRNRQVSVSGVPSV